MVIAAGLDLDGDIGVQPLQLGPEPAHFGRREPGQELATGAVEDRRQLGDEVPASLGQLDDERAAVVWMSLPGEVALGLQPVEQPAGQPATQAVMHRTATTDYWWCLPARRPWSPIETRSI